MFKLSLSRFGSPITSPLTHLNNRIEYHHSAMRTIIFIERKKNGKFSEIALNRAQHHIYKYINDFDRNEQRRSANGLWVWGIFVWCVPVQIDRNKKIIIMKSIKCCHFEID